MKNDKENIEAKDEQKAIDVTNDVIAFQEEKKKILEERGPPKPKMETTIKEIYNSHLDKFKDKIIKDFGLTSKIDTVGHHCMYFKDFLVVKLLPRKKWWYGVCREVPEQDNIWKAFRICSEKDEQQHYNHIKTFVDINSKGN